MRSKTMLDRKSTKRFAVIKSAATSARANERHFVTRIRGERRHFGGFRLLAGSPTVRCHANGEKQPSAGET